MANEQYQDYFAGMDNVHASFSMDDTSAADLPLKPLPAIPELNWREFLLWLLKRRSRHRIEGRSMLPTLKPGDEVIYHPQAYEKTSPQVGDLVIAQHPYRPELRMIKRIGEIESDSSRNLPSKRYWLLGDNPAESTDSRAFGWVERSQLLGKVTCRFNERHRQT